MTLGELIQECPVKDDEMVSVKKVDGDRVVLSGKGNWFTDWVLEFTDDEVIGFQWDKQAGWKITVTDPLPFR